VTNSIVRVALKLDVRIGSLHPHIERDGRDEP
jgi:hypothetical protein